jgi:hypothetical protein
MRRRSLCRPSWLRKSWKGRLWVSRIVAASFDFVCGDIFSRYVNVGLFYLRQLFFAKFDIKVHTDQGKQFTQLLWVLFKPFVCPWHSDGEDYTTLWNTLRESISLVKSPKTFGPGQASFAHITGGYDAGYYGCVYPVTGWPIVIYVYSIDTHTLLSSLLTCMRLCLRRIHWTPHSDRGIVRESSGWVEVERKLSHFKYLYLYIKVSRLTDRLFTQDFLGRPPNSEAFLKELFGTVATSNLWFAYQWWFATLYKSAIAYSPHFSASVHTLRRTEM